MPSKLRSSIYVMQENIHLSWRGSYKAKGEFFIKIIISQWGEEGSGSPREKFWKTDANGAFLAHFCRLPVFFFFFFLQNGYKWCILSPFIADCLLVYFVWKFHFSHESLIVQGVFPSFTGIMIWEELGFFLVQEGSRGQHSPPPLSKYFEKLMNWCNIHSETIFLADWTFVFYLKSFVGWGAIKWRRILVIREQSD